ncbi:MAG TPA: ABC transporter substrate-binding protein [Phototrophicaceae bacterium]|nr:ABC transporter substrate-binding protein [Phototrophicaceae bacterium]
MFRKFAWVMLVVVMLAVIPGAAAQEPVDVTFFMTFVPNIQFAPVYVALEKGYFADAGINLTIEHGEEPVGLDLIAANERQFGLISGEEVIKARANGRPVVYVYEWFQKYAVGIVVPEGVKSVKDLAGRKVGIPGRFGASYNGLVALLAANDMAESDIQLEPIGFNAPDVFCVGGVEASVVYINNEPQQIQQRIDQGECGAVTGINVFPVSDGADLVSNGLVTNETVIAENPELVQAIVTAFDKGLHDVINNPAEAYLLSAKYVENLPLTPELETALKTAATDQTEMLVATPEREAVAQSRADLRAALAESFDGAALLQFEVLLNTIELWDADVLGISDLKSWEVTQDILMTMDFLSAPIDLEAAFTNAFVPGLNEK